MVSLLLIMIAGGVGFSQCVSHQRQVTASWLRLGGLISVSLLSVAGVIGWETILGRVSAQNPNFSGTTVWLFVAGLVCCVAGLTAAQLGRVAWSRVAGGLVYAACVLCVWSAMEIDVGASTNGLHEAAHGVGLGDIHPIGWLLAISLAAGLQGGFLMTMLLGHAYLTEGSQMTQAPFSRLTVVLACLLGVRAIVSSVTGLWPYMGEWGAGAHSAAGYGSMFGGVAWDIMMITGRYAVGIFVPGVFVYMIYDCVKRRANQSATGILYVATVMVILGEGMAFSLAGSTGLVF